MKGRPEITTTPKIFYRFQQVLKATGKYVAEEHGKDRIYVIYKSQEHYELEVRP